MFIYNKSIIFKTLLASMTLFLATSCYDLDEMNKNPYEVTMVPNITILILISR